MANDEYQAAILKIVNEVDQLVTNNSAVRTVFTGHIDKLCTMVENYGQAQQPYIKKLEKTYKRMEKDRISGSPNDICPPPKGYVRINPESNSCVNIPTLRITHRPVEPANPLLWFGIIGNVDISIQRKPTEDEKLMCDYVRMAVIHDYEMLHSGTLADSYIISADYKGKWFEWDRFNEMAGGYYHPYPSQGITYHFATGQEKLSQLNRALDHVKADIERLPAGKEQKASGDNAGGTEPSDLITLTVAVKKFKVSKTTLRRATKDGRLEKYPRKPKSANSPLKVSENAVAKQWPRI